MKKKLLVCLTFILLFLSAVIAQEEESVLTYDMGDFAISVLTEVQRQGNPDVLIGATEEMIKEYMPTGSYPSAVNVFLIETEDKNILIDAGYGTKLFDNLKTLGKQPEEINAVLLTHMHGDHIGGLVKEGKRTFPKAQLYIPQPEYDYWMSDEAMQQQPENRRNGFTNAREVIRIYQDNLHLFTPNPAGVETNELFPGIQGIAAYGHTPGHTGYLLESEGKKLLIWGDLTHAMAIQIPHPEVAVTYDVDPVTATQYRQELLKYISENKIRIGGMHIEFPGMGDILGNSSQGYRFILFCLCEGR